MYHGDRLTELDRWAIQRVENFCPNRGGLDPLVQHGSRARWTVAPMGGSMPSRMVT
jgi:hypothetical protein